MILGWQRIIRRTKYNTWEQSLTQQHLKMAITVPGISKKPQRQSLHSSKCPLHPVRLAMLHPSYKPSSSFFEFLDTNNSASRPFPAVLNRCFRQLKTSGKGTSMSAPVVAVEDEEKFWETGAPGTAETAEQLLHTIFHLNGKNSLLCGEEEHYNLKSLRCSASIAHLDMNIQNWCQRTMSVVWLVID